MTCRVWWINQSKSYNGERQAGIIWAGYNVENPARQRVDRVEAGDVTIHNARGHVRALGRVQTDPEPREVEVHDGLGRAADVEYWTFFTPIHFRKFAEPIYQLKIPNGPLTRYQTGEHNIRQGYCFAFTHEALRIVKEHASEWPDWDELQAKARHSNTSRKAADVEENAQPSERLPSGHGERKTTRIIRDGQLSRRVKEKSGYRCQVCGSSPIELPDGTWYAEGHHLRPLSHEGPDVEENIICVCPSCHVKLDYGTIRLGHDALSEASESPVGSKFVKYHNSHVAGRK